MTERKSTQYTLVIASLIGAIGVIFAACIGLIPTVLPLVRSTSTPPFFVITATFLPSDTPAPETPSATTAATDLPTLTATLTPLVTNTPTLTYTSVPQTPGVSDYVGTWTNEDSDPTSNVVKLVVTRIEISKTGETTASFSVCRAAQGGERYVQPNPAPASIYAFGMTARDFVISSFDNLRWAIIVQRNGDQLVATVQEYDINYVLLNSDTFQLKKASLLNPRILLPCEEPTFSQ